MKKLIIAIDGHSSCGKSTMAKALAKKINYLYIDSGAMYRVITLFAIKQNLITNDTVNEEELKKHLSSLTISFQFNTDLNKHETYLNNENVENQIRTLEVSNQVSLVSKIGFVRDEMVRLQQDLGKGKGIVMDGRDIGTVVFPNADLKLFVTADVSIRAMRRYKELVEKGDSVTLEEVKENLEKRDLIDQSREVAPLKKAEDAYLLDNSELNQEEQLQWVINLMQKLFPENQQQFTN